MKEDKTKKKDWRMRVKGLWEVQVFGVAPLGKKKWPKRCCQRRRCEKACLFSIYLSVCMSVHVSVCLFVHLCLSLSTCLSFSNLTHLSAAGETRKLNIWDSLSLALSLALIPLLFPSPSPVSCTHSALPGSPPTVFLLPPFIFVLPLSFLWAR